MEEANARAASKAENCRAAREEIESLKAQVHASTRFLRCFFGVNHSNVLQLREIAEKATTQQVSNNDCNFNVNATNGCSNQLSGAGNVTSTASAKGKPRDNASTPSQTKAQAHKTEKTMQFEPGVFITILSLPNGVNELKRLRFRSVLFSSIQLVGKI